jgi:hypothetical protein
MKSYRKASMGSRTAALSLGTGPELSNRQGWLEKQQKNGNPRNHKVETKRGGYP